MGTTTQTIQRLNSIRNIGIIAHIDAGKTTLTERFLYYSGKTHKIGDVDSGNTVMDYLDEERSRGITIVAAAASFPWTQDGKPYLFHLIDTPGHIDFTAEVERSIRVSDGAVVIFSGVEGVEAQSEKVWRQSNTYSVPKIAFINKLDRIGASFPRVIGEVKSKFTDLTVVGMQLPIGIESDFSGVVDLMKMEAIFFREDDGSVIETAAIPQNMSDQAAEARDEMLSTIAELSDEIAELYLDEQEIAESLLIAEIRKLVIAGKLCPVFLGSAKKNIGIQSVLKAIVDFLPSPEDKPISHAISPKTGEDITVDINHDAFCGLIFKIVASGTADLMYMRTYSGTLSLNDTLLNPRTGDKVRIKRLLRLYSKNVEAMQEVGPGDIVGIIGPNNTITGDTLCAVNKPVLLEKITFPEPVISIAVEPKSTKDKDKLMTTLKLMCREDPTLNLRKHENTGQLILSGMGELHLEIFTNRIKNEFRIDARYGVPQVAFRETLKESAIITGIFNRTIGDQNYYAEVDIELTPAPRLEKGLEVEIDVKNKNSIPNIWITSAEDALNNGLHTGGNWGYPLIYIQGKITGIRGNDKTTEGAVAGAVLEALCSALGNGTKLLEPLMNLDIISPEENLGEISGYLQARRAIIHGIENMPDSKHLSCEVPLAEMFGFSKALPKLSGGRAAFSMEPCGYQEISQADLEKMVNRDSSFNAG